MCACVFVCLCVMKDGEESLKYPIKVSPEAGVKREKEFEVFVEPLGLPVSSHRLLLVSVETVRRYT